MADWKIVFAMVRMSGGLGGGVGGGGMFCGFAGGVVVDDVFLGVCVVRLGCC